MMQAHYRSILDFSNEAILASEKGYTRLMEAYKTIPSIEPNATSTFDVKAFETKLYEAMDDDFNTPILIAHLFDAVKIINSLKEGTETLNTEDLALLQKIMNDFVVKVLGLKEEETSSDSTHKLDGVLQMLIEMRNQARVDKNWTLSDQIRDELSSLGIQLKDSKDGTTYQF